MWPSRCRLPFGGLVGVSRLFRPHRRRRFGVDLAESCTDLLGGLFQVRHGFCEGVLDFFLESLGNAADLAVDATHRPENPRQSFGAENNETGKQEKDDFAPGQVEHSFSIRRWLYPSCVQQRLPTRREHPIAFAHRGARAHARENTIHAFQLALKLGANGVETDAWLTKDGVVVLEHDGVIRRGLRRVPIADLTRSELPAHVPTLSEYFDSVVTPVDLSIDVKDPRAADEIVSTAARAGFPADRLWLCHNEIETVLEFRRRFNGVRVVDSSRLARIKDGPEKRAALLAENSVDAWNMHINDWNGGLVTLAHRFGLYAFAWDVQFPPALENAFRMGLDAVYSDHVDRMVDAYAAEFGRLPNVD